MKYLADFSDPMSPMNPVNPMNQWNPGSPYYWLWHANDNTQRHEVATIQIGDGNTGAKDWTVEIIGSIGIFTLLFLAFWMTVSIAKTGCGGGVIPPAQPRPKS